MNSTTTTIMTVPPESARAGAGVNVFRVFPVSVGGSAATSGGGGSWLPLPSSMVVTWLPAERVTVSVRNLLVRTTRGYVRVTLLKLSEDFVAVVCNMLRWMIGFSYGGRTEGMKVKWQH